MEEPAVRPGHGLGTGVIAGLVGGVVLALARMAAAFADGREVWHALEMASAPILGERALEAGIDVPALLLGIVVHFAIAGAWGAAFGMFFHGLATRGTLIAGALYGLVVWFSMMFVVLPLAGLAELAAAVRIRDAILEHVLFGLTVGIAYAPFQPRFAEYWGPAEPPRVLAPSP